MLLRTKRQVSVGSDRITGSGNQKTGGCPNGYDGWGSRSSDGQRRLPHPSHPGTPQTSLSLWGGFRFHRVKGGKTVQSVSPQWLNSSVHAPEHQSSIEIILIDVEDGRLLRCQAAVGAARASRTRRACHGSLRRLCDRGRRRCLGRVGHCH